MAWGVSCATDCPLKEHHHHLKEQREAQLEEYTASAFMLLRKDWFELCTVGKSVVSNATYATYNADAVFLSHPVPHGAAKRLRREQLDAANAAAAAAAARQTQLATVGAHSSGPVQVGLLEP